MAKEKAEPKPKEYRALFGMNYPDPENEGEEIRVEAGDKIPVIPDDEWVTTQTNYGHIEEWVDRQTDNVHKGETEPGMVTGILSRHANDGEDIVLKGVDE